MDLSRAKADSELSSLFCQKDGLPMHQSGRCWGWGRGCFLVCGLCMCVCVWGVVQEPRFGAFQLKVVMFLRDS